MLIISYDCIKTKEKTIFTLFSGNMKLKKYACGKEEKRMDIFPAKPKKECITGGKTEIQEEKRRNRKGKSGRSPGNLPLSIGY